MDTPEVIVLGAGTAGLVAGALLANEGMRVLVLEPSEVLGGFSATYEVDGFTLNLGAHLMEDPGSGITAIFERLGLNLAHGAVSTGLPVWDHSTGRWGSIGDRYRVGRDELRRIITKIVATPFEEFDHYDDVPLRAWLTRHTDDPGVIDLFEFLAFLEFLTEHWWDHSASESLYLRKMHYGERGTAGYSWWPEGGWGAMFTQLRGAIVAAGGEVRTDVTAHLEISDHRVRGVRVVGTRPNPPNRFEEGQFIAADQVVVSLPVWRVLDVVHPRELPGWYVDQIETLAAPRHRDAWINLAYAVDDPCPVLDRRELGVWERGEARDRPGFYFEQTGMDPSTAPDGTFLYVVGGAIDPSRAQDRRYLHEELAKLESDVFQMLPGLVDAAWRCPQVIHDPSIGVVSKPTLVGTYRPSWRAPGVEGLWFAHETFRSRGIEDDRAARAALTTVEDLLGRRIDGLDTTWRY